MHTPGIKMVSNPIGAVHVPDTSIVVHQMIWQLSIEFKSGEGLERFADWVSFILKLSTVRGRYDLRD